MKPSDKHTYKDIAPEHISWVSSWTFDKNRKWKRVNDDLFFVLWMNFLTSNIKAKHYDHESVSDFCKQLVQLFTGEWIPNLAEQWTNNSNVLNYEYEAIIDEESKSHISRLIGDCIVKHPSFSHSRDYYVLGNWLQNLDKVHRVKDLFGKQEAQHYVQNVYAVSLVNIEQSWKTTLAWDVIPDDLNIVAETARIKAEENSLRESFWQETMDDYFARLAFYQHDLRAHYDMEIKNTSPRPWRLAILASIIA